MTNQFTKTGVLCPVCHQCTDCRTALVEFIGVVNLPLASGGVLVLDDVCYPNINLRGG